MKLTKDFAFKGTSEATQQFDVVARSKTVAKAITNPLGPLSLLVGTWKGTGFNQIWRPSKITSGGQDRFLQLNKTKEVLVFEDIGGDIPNRGLLQDDINLHGITYLQQVQDVNVLGSNGKPSGIHIEPGIWLRVPPTTNPSDPETVARLANIPHGTSMTAQGTAITVSGPPTFKVADITPFVIGQPTNLVPFPQESVLTNPTNFRSPPAALVGITQAMVNNPNTVLASGLAGKTITQTIVLDVSTAQMTPPVPTSGGGTGNIAFLVGSGGNPNASAVRVDATFWIETFKVGSVVKHQLQYTQRVLLNFNGLSWPHVSVATLIKQ